MECKQTWRDVFVVTLHGYFSEGISGEGFSCSSPYPSLGKIIWTSTGFSSQGRAKLRVFHGATALKSTQLSALPWLENPVLSHVLETSYCYKGEQLEAGQIRWSLLEFRAEDVGQVEEAVERLAPPGLPRRWWRLPRPHVHAHDLLELGTELTAHNVCFYTQYAYKRHSLDSGEVKRQTLVGGELIRDIFLQILLKSWLEAAYYYIQGYFSPFTLKI